MEDNNTSKRSRRRRTSAFDYEKATWEWDSDSPETTSAKETNSSQNLETAQIEEEKVHRGAKTTFQSCVKRWLIRLKKNVLFRQIAVTLTIALFFLILLGKGETHTGSIHIVGEGDCEVVDVELKDFCMEYRISVGTVYLINKYIDGYDIGNYWFTRKERVVISFRNEGDTIHRLTDGDIESLQKSLNGEHNEEVLWACKSPAQVMLESMDLLKDEGLPTSFSEKYPNFNYSNDRQNIIWEKLNNAFGELNVKNYAKYEKISRQFEKLSWGSKFSRQLDSIKEEIDMRERMWHRKEIYFRKQINYRNLDILASIDVTLQDVRNLEKYLSDKGMLTDLEKIVILPYKIFFTAKSAGELNECRRLLLSPEQRMSIRDDSELEKILRYEKETKRPHSFRTIRDALKEIRDTLKNNELNDTIALLWKTIITEEKNVEGNLLLTTIR